MKNFEEGQLVEYSNSDNTRRLRGRFRGWDDDGNVVIQPVKNPDRTVRLDPEGAAVKPI